MKIFLDVGANTGQTLAAVLPLDFDRIVCFEPASACWPKLEAMADERVTVARYGLWNRECEHDIFQPGSKGAGVWKKDNGRTDETEACQFRRASDWLSENTTPADTVYLKLNCEGAECDILDDLLDAGMFDRIAFTMIDFDVRKIAAQKHRQAEIMERLSGYPFQRVATSKQVMIGATHADRIRNWLSACV